MWRRSRLLHATVKSAHHRPIGATAMIAYVEVPGEAALIDIELKSLGKNIIDNLSVPGKQLSIERGTDLFSCVNNCWVFIHDGVFKYYHQSKLVRFYERGDMLAVQNSRNNYGSRCMSEFGAVISTFSDQEIATHIATHPNDSRLFFRYLVLQTTVMHILCAAYTTDDLQPDFKFTKFDPGTVIIAEGSPALEIYQMVEGTATVTVKNVAVGTIEAGEVFGEISFFTGGTRSATVTATTECLIQVMQKNDFLTMVTLKPSVNLAISKTLSQRLVETNRKIAGNS